ncbi:MAG: 3-oxoacyl-ACP reductase [Nocardioidaceae bacterium]
MSDRYQMLTETTVGTFVAKNLGLPRPTRLKRYQPGQPLLSGSVLVGGTGRLREQIISAVDAGGAEPVTSDTEGSRYAGLVFDATDLTSSDQLVALQAFFSPVMRRLRSCPRVVVVGSTPELADDPPARVAQRALEGFTRTVGKEIGRGGTVQLVYVAPGAEDRVGSTLTFLLSPKSAYVSGQVIGVGTDLETDEPSAVDPQHPLTGKVALVTGASRGIGEAIARTLHRDGATVVGVDVPQAASALQQLMGELEGESLTVDITGVDAPQRLARALREGHGGVDIVVHNAGITRDKKLANMDTARWSSVIAVNLTAPERITAELLEQGLFRPNGRVVGVASIAGIAGNVGQANYATSKAGVIGLVDSLAPVAAEHGVTVNAVAPGFIETKMTAAVPLMTREAGRRMNSLSQGGLPLDVAETIAWYADPRSYGVTGNVVRVCGQSLLGA